MNTYIHNFCIFWKRKHYKVLAFDYHFWSCNQLTLSPALAKAANIQSQYNSSTFTLTIHCIVIGFLAQGRVETKWSWIYIGSSLHTPYICHYNLLLIRNHSWILLTIHKARILRKKPLEKMFLYFKKWVKSIQTAGYNGARTVYILFVTVVIR